MKQKGDTASPKGTQTSLPELWGGPDGLERPCLYKVPALDSSPVQFADEGKKRNASSRAFCLKFPLQKGRVLVLLSERSNLTRTALGKRPRYAVFLSWGLFPGTLSLSVFHMLSSSLQPSGLPPYSWRKAGAGLICGALCKMKMQGSLFKITRISRQPRQSFQPTAGSF